ncbi:unnamed protein product [Linum trigynum]|uniref:EF-hand domain-containing protein n=1 Tax=Linum trigynum TaxID=586398 RepID=A0AAV2D3G3_9ROSI
MGGDAVKSESPRRVWVPETKIESKMLDAMKQREAAGCSLRSFNSILLKFPKIDNSLKKCKAIFEQFDLDCNGTIDHEELRKCFNKLEIYFTEEEINDLFAACDINDDYGMNFHEFIVLLCLVYLLKAAAVAADPNKPKMGMPNLEASFETLVDAFVFFDKNMDGYVSKNELIQAIQDSGERAAGRIALRRFEEMDWDKNGMVNIKEFLFAFTKWVGIEDDDDDEEGDENAKDVSSLPTHLFFSDSPPRLWLRFRRLCPAITCCFAVHSSTVKQIEKSEEARVPAVFDSITLFAMIFRSGTYRAARRTAAEALASGRPTGCQYAHQVFDFSFSSLSSSDHSPRSSSNVNFRSRPFERRDFDDNGNDHSKRLRQMGVSDVEVRAHEVLESDCSDEFEESDVDGGDDDEKSFKVLDSFNRDREQKQETMRIELGEHELRHPLVREVCRLIDRRSAWNPKMEAELKNLLRSLKPRLVCAVLRSQADERVALSFFYWADRQWRYRHHPIVYYVLLEMLSKTKLCQGARRIIVLMARRGVERRPEIFSYLMISYSRAGRLRNAMQVLTRMQKAGIEPNLLICNTTILVLVLANRMDKALRFMERMQLVGITPNVVTYNALIKGYCDVHRVEDAMELIAEMPFKGCPPDKVSYYTVMTFLCKEKRIEQVRSLMETMVKSSKLLPDQVTYNILIHVLSKHQHSDEALVFLREAEERGFPVDKVEYSAVVDSYCKQGKMDRAKEIVNEMLSKGCAPDVVTYTAVVNGLCQVGEVEQATRMLQQMYKHGCKPNTVSYTALLNGLCRNGNSSKAREMMNMSEEEWWTPNVITYSVVMHGLRREEKLSEACDVVREMVGKGFFPTPVEINQLLQALCSGGKADVAKKFMEECLHNGCAVNSVNFTTVIHGFCQNDNLEAALSLLDDMYLSNKHPDAVTYTAVIDALCKKGRMDEATEIATKMLKQGVDPTPVTFRTVIHGYCQMGRVEDLLKLLDKMLSRQKIRTVYNQVIEKLCRFGNPEAADNLLGNVLRTASRIDANTCHVLMESHLSKGVPLSAYNVACRMFNRNLIPDIKLCEKVSKKLKAEGKSKEADSLLLRFVERGSVSPQHFLTLKT